MPEVEIEEPLEDHQNVEPSSESADGTPSPTDAAADDNSKQEGEIIPTPNDVILGRGSFLNDHPGNRRFRALALERKFRFDAGTPSDKRSISEELVQMIKRLVPHGRFLKRASHALQAPILLDEGRYRLPPRGLDGPWEEISEEKAVAKACQVIVFLPFLVVASRV